MPRPRVGLLRVVLCGALVLSAAPAAAQVSGSSLLEAQNGNRPFNPFDPQPRNRIDLYDQLNLTYDLTQGRIGARFEINENSQDQNAYQVFTQRWAEWMDEGYKVRVGNFHTLLGRGLIHRSFELPGVVLDDIGLRSRFGPSRDVDGLFVEGSKGPVSGRLFGGRPTGGERSPAHDELGEDRYFGQLAGGQAAVTPRRDLMVGAAYLRSSNPAGESEFGSGFVEFDPLAGFHPVSLPFYVEYAQQDGSLGEWFEFRNGEDVPHALYAGANLLWSTFALSAEWKDYRDFRLGTNDPPSLVKEHPWTLLNRNTHVLNATDEEGFQIETSWGHRLGSVTVNRSRADGVFGRQSRRFEETYVEAHVSPFGPWTWEGTLFYDRGRDGFQFITDRDIWGGSVTVVPLPDISLTIDFQTQCATRVGDVDFNDQFLSCALARAGWGSAAVVWERSTDPAQEKIDDFAEPGIQARYFLAGVISGRLTGRHEATLFFGERRGGPACTAGTCYEVQPFVGVELRLVSRF